MISQKDLYSLRYFLAFVTAILGFYVYSALTGWQWVGGVKTEKEKSEGTYRGGHYYRNYHK